MPALEQTFIAIKPDGAQRGLVGQIMSRFERRGYRLVAAKFVTASKALLEEHYEEHKGKAFLPSLLEYMQSGPVMAMVWEGVNVIANSRDMIGATDARKASPGTIRGDYCQEASKNLVHGSDSLESAKREIALWFKEEELNKYTLASHPWVHED